MVELGYRVLGIRIVPDDPELLFEEVERAARDERLSCVIMTGGLGPTADDHTVDVLARLSGRAIVEDEEALRKMELLSRRWKRRFDTSAARRQARVLEGVRVLRNERGLAPGMALEFPRNGSICLIAALPGVPQEMRTMFENELLPLVSEQVPSERLEREVFYLYGVGESTFQGRYFGRPDRPEEEAVARALELPPDFTWGVTAARGYIKVFFESRQAELLKQMAALAKSAFAEEFIPQPAQDLLHERLIEGGRTLALAESCTGGWIGKLLTDRPGSSRYLLGGVTSYANSAKQNILGVPDAVLRDHGAVSEACAVAMAEGTRRLLGADFGLSVTGIAGPDGGTPEKPVGTVFTAAAGPEGTRCVRLDLPMDRDRVREYSTNLAIFHLLRYISARAD